MIEYQNYFEAEWQILYLVILATSWYIIDKSKIPHKYFFVLALILAIPTYLIIVNVIGTLDNHTNGMREIDSGANFFLISLLPGSIIGAIITLLLELKFKIQYHFYIKQYKKKRD